MSAITITQFWNVGKYRLNITLRNNREIDPQTLHHVIADTVAAWMYLAKLIETKAWDTEIQTSAPNVEAKHLGAAAVEDWNDALVTVWDAEQGGQKIGLTFHSNSSLVTAFVNYIGYQSAMEAVVQKWPSSAEKAQNTRQTPPQGSKYVNAAETAQKAAGGAIYANSKSAQEQPDDTVATIRILKIKLSQQDDKSYYGLYGKYGHNVSQHPDVRVYLDNERALENGVLADLDSIGLKVGQVIEGEWHVHCRVYTNRSGKKALDVQAITVPQSA